VIILCSECHRRFDDQFRWTICPHQTFAANDGQNNFAHHPESFRSAEEAPRTDADRLRFIARVNPTLSSLMLNSPGPLAESVRKSIDEQMDGEHCCCTHPLDQHIKAGRCVHPGCDCLCLCDCHIIVAEMRDETANAEPQALSSASPEAKT
jgi:hypothetical protein